MLTLVVATSTAPSTVISPAIFLLRGNVVSISSISIFLDKPDDAPEDLSAVHGDEVDKLLNEVLQSLISPRRFNAAAMFVLQKNFLNYFSVRTSNKMSLKISQILFENAKD